MNILNIVAGWGPCGALNSAGETEFYAVATALQLLVLGVSGLLLMTTSSRFVKQFDANRSSKPLYVILNVVAGLIKVAVICTTMLVLIDFVVGDANLGGYDGSLACDPIDGGIVAQATFILTLTLFLSYKQYAKYRSKNR